MIWPMKRNRSIEELKGSVGQVKTLIEQLADFVAAKFTAFEERLLRLEETKADKEDVKKIEERHASFREIYIHMKMIHNNQYEIQIKTTLEGDVKHFEVTDYNLFFALDNALNRALQHS